MLRLCLNVVAVLLLAACHPATTMDQQAVQSAIRAVLDQQVRDWNEGSVERFMRGYQQAGTTRFASGGTISLGWQVVLDRYKTNYADKAAMGKLTFSGIDITVVSPDAALVFGRWHLKREQDEPSGLFTLFFRNTAEGWRIVHDHTSAANKN